jgi:chemotaxis-related protein WspD
MIQQPINDCWNRIGVRGDGSCPELVRHVHCRNCEMHGAAALALLDAEPPADAAASWTAHFSIPVREAPRATTPLFVFRSAAEWLAIPPALVTEVAALRTIHSLPHRRTGGVLGVVNVHGALVTCVSLAQLLGLDDRGAGGGDSALARRRLLVLRRQGLRLACPADEVHGLHHVPAAELLDSPTAVTGARKCTTRVFTWRDRSVGVLDEALLAQAVIRSLA